MKFGPVRLMAVVAFCLPVYLARAQSSGYHQLRVEEFQGFPDVTSRDNVAYTNCYIDFNYHAKSERGSTVLLTCDVKLIFDREKSWINHTKVTSAKMIKDILDHEQGHYMIAYMEQQELLRTINKTRFDTNYQIEASNIFDRIHEKYKQLSLDYDDDTGHMQNHEQQHSWDTYFKKRLAYMPQTELARNQY